MLQGRRRCSRTSAPSLIVVTSTICPECGGSRLNEAARSSKIEGKNIADVCADADQRPGRVDPGPGRTVGSAPLLTGLQHLLESFAEIGLGYSLDRPSGSLSEVKHNAPR